MEYVLVIMAYLCGSIPFGLIIGKSLGVDIRKGGSGNIGATNVNRQLGRKSGVLTLLGDVGKAIFPMSLAAYMMKGRLNSEKWILFCGAAAFLGHMFPIYLRFKGGKGVATALGIFLYLEPKAALICIVVFALSVGLSGYVSLGSLISAAAMPLVLWFFGKSWEEIVLSAFVAAFIWIKHRENILRLVNNKEKSWKKPSQDTARVAQNKKG